MKTFSQITFQNENLTFKCICHVYIFYKNKEMYETTEEQIYRIANSIKV